MRKKLTSSENSQVEGWISTLIALCGEFPHDQYLVTWVHIDQNNGSLFYLSDQQGNQESMRPRDTIMSGTPIALVPYPESKNWYPHHY